MSGIVHSVTQVKDLMQEIAAASDEQNRGIAQIAQAMSEMDTTTQQNAALVQESSAAAGAWKIRQSSCNNWLMYSVCLGYKRRRRLKRQNVHLKCPLCLRLQDMMQVGRHSKTET
jgi:hypothetical protein